MSAARAGVAKDTGSRLPAGPAVLYEFTDRLYRSRSSQDVYDAALEAICRGLKCKRASILLFDNAGVMRFVAWSGLSETYRKAVDGHSPWRRGEINPEPIFVSDVRNDPDLAALLPVAAAEDIRALAFIPIVEGNTAIGKFMAYYPEPHDFTPEEAALGITIALQLSFALGLRRAEDSRIREQAAQARLAAIVESSLDAIISKDLKGKILTWNTGAQRIFGYTSEEAIGQSILKLIPPERQTEEIDILDRICRGENMEHFETVRRRKDGALVDVSLTISPLKNAAGQIVGASKIARDITERRRAEAHRTLLINELNHRVKNTLATVQSLATQTLRTTEKSADAQALFEARLAALSRAHDVLTNENWSGADLGDIVRRTLAPFQAQGGRIATQGPSLRLSPKQALAIAMALHELATNAAKYGALSSAEGRVDVAWAIETNTSPASIVLTWKEANGPRVRAPSHTGFGSRMIRRHLGTELDGKVDLDFAESGVVCRIETPLGWGMGEAASAGLNT